MASDEIGTDPSGGRAKGATGTGVTVEGRWPRMILVAVLLTTLSVTAFVAGRAGAHWLHADGQGEGALRSDQEGPAAAGPTGDRSQPGERRSGAGIDPDLQPVANPNGRSDDRADGPENPDTTPASDQVRSLGLVAYDEPLLLIDAETDPELNNSTAVDLASPGGAGTPTSASGPEQATRAVIADLVVTGPAGSTVSVHPGDRPADAMRFAVPASGRLLVPHLIAATDDAGRIVVSASDQVRVQLHGIGRYVAAERARAGRFVATESIRIGSLVTATDGRDLVVELQDALGDDSKHVGLAVLRLNANVSPAGGSVTVGSGPEIPWPAPSGPDLGLAGTELLTVRPDVNGEITVNYQGGSVLTVDLVGYYTNDAAPESTSGLYVPSLRPELHTIEIDDQDESFGLDSASQVPDGAAGPPVNRAVVTIEVANGSTGGSIVFWTAGEPIPPSPAFALAPDQRRSSTEWFSPALGPDSVIRAPEGAVLRIWTLGGYT